MQKKNSFGIETMLDHVLVVVTLGFYENLKIVDREVCDFLSAKDCWPLCTR